MSPCAGFVCAESSQTYNVFAALSLQQEIIHPGYHLNRIEGQFNVRDTTAFTYVYQVEIFPSISDILRHITAGH